MMRQPMSKNTWNNFNKMYIVQCILLKKYDYEIEKKNFTFYRGLKA